MVSRIDQMSENLLSLHWQVRVRISSGCCRHIFYNREGVIHTYNYVTPA